MTYDAASCCSRKVDRLVRFPPARVVTAFQPAMSDAEHDFLVENAEALSFRTTAFKRSVQAVPISGVHGIKDRPPTRGGDVYDQYHKRQVTIADETAENNKFKKTAEEMFEMKMQLKYGSPLVSQCFAWGHETEWV